MRSLLACLLFATTGSSAFAATATDGVLTLESDFIGLGPVVVTDSTTGEFVSNLQPPQPWIDPSDSGYFGNSLDVDASLAVVGAPASFSVGRAFLYNAIDGQLLFELEHGGGDLDGGRSRAQYGSTVKIDGNLVAVAAHSAYYTSSGPPPYFGSVFLFDAKTGELIQEINSQNLASALPMFEPFGTDIELLPNEVRVQWGDPSLFSGWLSFPRPTTLPEPTTVGTLGIGLLAAASWRRRL